MAAKLKRPPQFVVIAFDDCNELATWHQLADFIQQMKQNQESINFTFFLSGTTFLTDSNKYLYQGPNHKPGEAEIPFGGTIEDVKNRIKMINKFYTAGSEFGSHAVGHFDGSNWTTRDWEKEFQIYQNLFTNVAQNNGLPKTIKFAYPLSEIVGFRAPYLGKSPALYPALKAYHFRYDTNSISKADAWPVKKNGLWFFDLVKLKIAGTDKNTISMDYNFWMSQSNAKPDPKNQNRYRDQMYQTYINYFLNNYTGNRAPIRIGHHFTPFQGGVYNEALFAFAKKVCGLPEVRCVPFVKLADYMDQLSPSQLAAYQNGDFVHAAKPNIDLSKKF